MDHAKKFILVDPLKFESMMKESNTNAQISDVKSKSVLNDPSVAELHELDSEMNKILLDNKLTAAQKVERYNEVLSQFQDKFKLFREKPVNVNVVKDGTSNKPVEMKEDNDVKLEDIEVKREKDSLFMKQIGEGLSKTARARSNALITEWSKQNELQISDNGELIIDDKLITGSNAHELITALLRSRSNPYTKHKPLIGWRDVLNSIKSLKLPNNVIKGFDPNTIASPSARTKQQQSKQRNLNRGIVKFPNTLQKPWIGF